MEIERKFLMKDFPSEFPLEKEALVLQGYLSCLSPTVRIRSMQTSAGCSYRLCCKGSGTLAREEVELDLTEEKFKALCKLLPIPLVQKEYRVYLLPTGEHLECSWVDRGTRSQFCYAEVEFETIEEANAFVPPQSFGSDVTEEPYYAMSSYWRRKILPIPIHK